jgi:hypothetical protein
MNDKLKATSHAKKSSWAGPPVLVVLDPGISTYIIDFSKEEDVKLWVISRLPIYYSEDGKNWEHGYGDFEGCLTRPKIIIKDGYKYQEHLSLKQKPYYIHYTAVLPPEAEKQKRFDTFAIKDVAVESPRKDIVRPYPEGFTDAQKKFDFGIFREGIEVLKIPSSKVIYVSGSEKLRYWESLFFKNSKGGIYGKLRNKEIAGEPWSSQEADDLKKALDGKRGIYRSTLKKGKEENILEPKNVFMQLDRDDQLFAFGMSEDVARSEGSGKPLALKEEEPKEREDPCAQIQLYKISPYTIINPTQDFYSDFIANDLGKMISQFQIIDKSTSDEAMLKIINDYINKIRYLTPSEKKDLMRQFHICTEDTEPKCIMLAVSNAIENWRFSLSTYHSDLASDRKFDSSCVLSVKPFYFATGSDAYSNEIVPKHIFFQIKEWWENQLYEHQRKEIAEETAEIEIIGYSSKKTRDESDNIRLRLDRAWKTAKSLELVIKNSVKDRKIEIIPGLVSSEHFRKLGVSPKPVSIENKLPIFYLGEDLDIYPKRSIFKLEGNYVMDLVLDTQISVKEPLKASTDDPEDRACLIIFKRPIPDKVNQIVKSVVITNNASPIFTYRNILYHEVDGGQIRMVVFVCPGEFAN